MCNRTPAERDDSTLFVRGEGLLCPGRSIPPLLPYPSPSPSPYPMQTFQLGSSTQMQKRAPLRSHSLIKATDTVGNGNGNGLGLGLE